MARSPRPDAVSPTPTLAQLRALVAVTDAGGFSEAAAELGVSQSTLSEAVGKLEDLAGRPLLRRGPAGTVPTGAGARVLGHARAALQAAADVMLAAQEPDELRGTLRIASYRSAATHLLPPALVAFRARHPGVRVQLLDSEADACGGGEHAVRSGVVDVAVVVRDDLSDLTLQPLAHDEYLFVAPQSRGEHPVVIEEIGQQTLFLPPSRDTCHLRIRAYLNGHGLSLTNLVENGQDSVILSMVAHGLGVTIMPRLALLPLPPGLLTLPLPVPLLRPLALAVQPQRAQLPVIRAFTDTLIRTLNAPAGAGGPPLPQPTGRAADPAQLH